MLVMSLAPVLGTVGVLGGALVVGVAALVMVRQRRQHVSSTPDQAYRELELRIRHPWAYRGLKLGRWFNR